MYDHLNGAFGGTSRVSVNLYLATFWLRVRRYLCCQWFTAEKDTHDAFRKAGSGLSVDMNRSFALLIWMTEECNRALSCFIHIFLFLTFIFHVPHVDLSQ